MSRQYTLVLALLGPVVASLAPGRPARDRASDCGAGLSLPPGFCATMVADGLGWARHLAVRANGDLYVAIRSVEDPEARTARWRRSGREPGGVVALRDTTGDGRADVVVRFGDQFQWHGGTGLAIRGDTLYWALDTLIVRYTLPSGALAPGGPPEVLVSGFPTQVFHGSKAIALNSGDALFVGVGAPSNACQLDDRQAGAAGRDPCPELELRAAVWRFSASRPGQRFPEDGHRYATGIRNALALEVRPETGDLYAVQHGRDQLADLWPDRFSAARANDLPAEEMLRLTDGARYPWPYCFYDPRARRYVLAPEYGGDGAAVGRCADFAPPAAVFPAHYSPNDLVFYDGTAFPARYRGGAFIAFHGSWNRVPHQAGFLVAFVPTDRTGPAGPWERFADGFAGPPPIGDLADARHRPTGLAVGADGALFVADSRHGRIWRIRYHAP